MILSQFWPSLDIITQTAKRYIQSAIQSIYPYALFWAETLRTPRTMGAILPSSDHLAEAVASYAQTEKGKLVVELGAGTGVVTKALIDGTLDPADLIVIECSPAFVDLLNARFSGLNIIADSAENLSSILLKNGNRPLMTVVSSIPLRSLPADVSKKILDEIRDNLQPGGKYIQFTYNLLGDRLSTIPGMVEEDSQVVWMNFPPAKVCVYRKLKPELQQQQEQSQQQSNGILEPKTQKYA